MSFIDQGAAPFFASMNSVINKWIADGSPYAQGVLIYKQFGTDSFLKRLFNRAETSFYKDKLVQALTDLLSVEPNPVETAAPSQVVQTSPVRPAKVDQASPPPTPPPAATPELLKVISQIDSTYAEIRGLHPYLSILPEGPELHRLAKNIAQLGRRNAELWQRRHYLNEHGSDYQEPEPIKPVMIDLNLLNERERVRKSLNKAENRAKKQGNVNTNTQALIAERKKELEDIDVKIALIKAGGGDV